MSFSRAFGFVVGALLTVAIGYAILSRIPPVWRFIKGDMA